MRVAICISTYRRPEGLRRLLDGLARLQFEQIERPEIGVIVVDNDARGRAQLLCEELSPGFPWRLRPLDEPRRGITFARNRGLRAAAPDADFIAIIDDDEEPTPSWLEALLVSQRRHAADVVAGPVVPRFEAGVPGWIVRGGFFGPRRHGDGSALAVAFTNNVLMRAGLPGELGGGFDDRFALTGGEDTDFFMRAHRAGFRIVWAADAVVHETIPASRARVGWLLRRGYREWGSHSRCESRLYPTARVRAARVVKGLGLIGLGLASLPVGAVRGKEHAVWSMLRVARGLGSLAGLLGLHYAEYAHPEPPGATASGATPGRLE